MNNVKQVQRINEEEIKKGSRWTLEGSWHYRYRHSAWVFVGNLDYQLSEGDVICILSQYGEIEDLNMPRDDKSGKPKGFCFAKYEDFRSTVLAVDNFNGAELLGRTLRVDHMDNYTPPEKKKIARSEIDLGPKKFVAGSAYVEDGVLPEFIRSRAQGEGDDERGGSEAQGSEQRRKVGDIDGQEVFAEGSKVLVRFGGRKVWIPAIVEKVNADGTYGVRKELASEHDIVSGVDVFAPSEEQREQMKERREEERLLRKAKKKLLRKQLKKEIKKEKKKERKKAKKEAKKQRKRARKEEDDAASGGARSRQRAGEGGADRDRDWRRGSGGGRGSSMRGSDRHSDTSSSSRSASSWESSRQQAPPSMASSAANAEPSAWRGRADPAFHRNQYRSNGGGTHETPNYRRRHGSSNSQSHNRSSRSGTRNSSHRH